MGKLEQLQALIADLTPEEQASFREWYLAFEADAWDDQIERDARDGRLDRAADAALAAHRAGKSRPL